MANLDHPAPVRLPHDEPFWDATARGVLLVKHCSNCDRPHWYPRVYCPFCGSNSTQWLETNGLGTIYSFSIVSQGRRRMAAAIVELDAGPRVTTVIVDSDVHAMRIGDRVRVAFDAAEDGSSVPVFTTLAADAARTYSQETLASSAEVSGLVGADARAVEVVAVIGGGTMGSGIAKALISGGFEVVLVEPSTQTRERALQELSDFVDKRNASGTGEVLSLDRVHLAEAIEAAADADLVIEAVWEDRALKQEVLAALDRITRPESIIATNTSTIDVNVLAAATQHPERVLGMHFFSPAHIMRLVEVIRGDATSAAALATAIEVSQRMAKTPVVVGVCHGFVGNRMMIARNDEAQQLLLEGALPDQVDRVIRETGLPMGPFEMLDLGNGIEVNVRRRQESGEPNWLIDELYRRGRSGQRAGRGFYRYEEGKRGGRPDPEVAAVIEQASAEAGITRRRIPDREIAERLLERMVVEGQRILDEGVASSAGDVDVIWREGFGWPEWKGGPMYAAGVR